MVIYDNWRQISLADVIVVNKIDLIPNKAYLDDLIEKIRYDEIQEGCYKYYSVIETLMVWLRW